MPNPNHCLDCDKPINFEWSHLCENCADKHMNELIVHHEETTADEHNKKYIEESDDWQSATDIPFISQIVSVGFEIV